ncbi:MAG: hypothetical protein OXH72_09685, partial [Caldilineaceae bacterium]|nr:hypothetical protein [Caldilineaceae bacterium]
AGSPVPAGLSHLWTPLCHGTHRQVRNIIPFTFHYYDGEDLGNAKLGGRELTWNSEGWPELGQLLIGPED